MINKEEMNAQEREQMEKAERILKAMATCPLEDVTDEARAVLAADVDPYFYILAVYNQEGGRVDQTWEREFTAAIITNGGTDPGAPESSTTDPATCADCAQIEMLKANAAAAAASIDPDYEAWRASL